MKYSLAFLFVLICFDAQKANALPCDDISSELDLLSLEGEEINRRLDEYAKSDTKTCRLYREQMLPLAKRTIEFVNQVTGSCQNDFHLEFSEEEMQANLRNLEKESVRRCAAAGM
jgi:hypothetical protein